ncbi:EthD family reductase [Pendulispora brunnea]|uniref:EthD family reductase n=1 Tax=Pendulispora brunnea TaxID=2905690 RepID=A0ABZ2KAV0_9BACT
MIRVSVIYPAGEGKVFDLAYYTNEHMPLAGKLLKPIRYEIDDGLTGATPDSSPPYLAASYLYFETADDFHEAAKLHLEQLVADIPNYTNSEPVIQISKVVASVSPKAE